jgi:hypothetical protein
MELGDTFKLSIFAFVASTLCAVGVGCGGGSATPAGSGGSHHGQTSGGANGSGGGAGTGGSTGGAAPSCAAGFPVAPMTLISKGAPAFASDGDPTGANADQPASAWYSSNLPAWIAYDISKAPAADRQNALVSWYSIHNPCYIDTNTNPAQSSAERPLAYTIETNTAPGGGSPPAAGWQAIVTVPDNRYCGRQHYVSLNSASWIRMNVTMGGAGKVGVALDVQSAASCASDSWLFMGDSITYMTMTHAFCDLPELVAAAKPAYWPAVLDGALGGTNTVTATSILDDTMMDFPGRFVVLAYGTNDHPASFQMEGLVQKVLAVGKTPVVPHMPWSDTKLQDGPAINAQIDALYQKYPQIVKGPDLWAFFAGHTEWIPSGDVHPNSDGQEQLRKQWALTMEGLYQ